MSESTVPASAKVVVIGAGIVGNCLVGHLARLGEHQPAGDPLEERFAELFLQQFDLFGDGRLGKVEHLAGVADAVFADDGPEVVEMVVVELMHEKGNIEKTIDVSEHSIYYAQDTAVNYATGIVKGDLQ